MNDSYLDLAELTYLTPENAVFTQTESGFPALKAFLKPVNRDDLEQNADETPIWQELGRVYLHRAFPFDTPDEFICVLDKDGKEYGMIRNITDFDGEQAEIIVTELKRKYFCPEITKVYSLKEKLGYSFWNVETNFGKMSFSMHDTYKNIVKVGENRIFLTDVDGNRYSVTDTLALDSKSYRKIELYL